MFKISYIVDDKKLPDMLRACAGHVYHLDVVPVANAEPVKVSTPKPKLLAAPKTAIKKVREVQYSGKRNFTAEFGWQSGHQFRGKDVGQLLPKIGLLETSQWYVIMNELKAGRTKKVSQGLYEVVA